MTKADVGDYMSDYKALDNRISASLTRVSAAHASPKTPGSLPAHKKRRLNWNHMLRAPFVEEFLIRLIRRCLSLYYVHF